MSVWETNAEAPKEAAEETPGFGSIVSARYPTERMRQRERGLLAKRQALALLCPGASGGKAVFRALRLHERTHGNQGRVRDGGEREVEGEEELPINRKLTHSISSSEGPNRLPDIPAPTSGSSGSLAAKPATTRNRVFVS